MKNKKKLISALSIGSVAATVAPLALMATSCSCSNNSKDLSMFECDDVTDGQFVPDYKPYGGASSAINMLEGNGIYFKQLKEDLTMPQQEHKWGASELVDIVAYLNETLTKWLGEDAPEEDIITINKIGASIQDFKLESSNADKVIASYTSIEDINLSLNWDLPEEYGEYLGFTSLSGSIRLAWNHKVNKMPLALFDLDPSSFLEGKVFEDQTIWFMAPDPTQCEYEGDASKEWYIDSNYLVDVKINKDNEKLIDLDNTIFNYRYDSTTYMMLFMMFMESPALCDLIARVLPLTAGWSAYYLSQVEQLPHVNIQWKDYSHQAIEGEPDIVYTSIAEPATAKCEFVEKGVYDESSVTTMLLPFSGDKLTNLDLHSLSEGQLFCQSGSSGEDDSFLYTVDWRGFEERPADGYRWSWTERDRINYERVVPLIMTKDWITLGDPVIIQEKGIFTDPYLEHEDAEHKGMEYININDFDGASVDLEFPITNDDVAKMMKEPDFCYINVVSSQPIGTTPTAEMSGWDVVEDKTNGGYKLVVHLYVYEWESTPPTDEEATTMDFSIEISRGRNSQYIGPFVLRYGNGMYWNNKVSTYASINADAKEKATTIGDAIQFVYKGESKEPDFSKSECEIKGVGPDFVSATVSKTKLIDETKKLYSADITFTAGEEWDSFPLLNQKLGLKITDGTTTQTAEFTFNLINEAIWNYSLYGSDTISFTINTRDEQGLLHSNYSKGLRLIQGCGIDANTKVEVKAMQLEQGSGNPIELKWLDSCECVQNSIYPDFADIKLAVNEQAMQEWYNIGYVGYTYLQLSWIENATGIKHTAYVPVNFWIGW